MKINKKHLPKIKKYYKQTISSKLFIATIFTLLGACGGILTTSQFKEKTPTHPIISHNDIFDDDFFIHHSPFDNAFHSNIFKEMEAMHRQMEAHFQKQREYIRQSFSQQKKKHHNHAKLIKRQDKEFYYYELHFSGYQKDDITVTINNNSLTFKADVKKEDEHSQQTSNFYYSFSLPQYDQKTDPKIEKNDGVITVRLKK